MIVGRHEPVCHEYRLPNSCLEQDKAEAKSVQVLMLCNVMLMCVHTNMAFSNVALLQFNDC